MASKRSELIVLHLVEQKEGKWEMRMDGTSKKAVVNFMIYNPITSNHFKSLHLCPGKVQTGHAERHFHARVKVRFIANTLHEYVLRYFTVLILR